MEMQNSGMEPYDKDSDLDSDCGSPRCTGDCERDVLLVTTYSRNHVTDNTDQQLFHWCMARPGSPLHSGRA
ncbi:hypothetical protein pipiens_011257 [Culex pipiens pipiens]|uniref:Uncharacterized protein n=1 Tax=Culex pipiens pipiens TaxID=38569 RepID=A0ABD1D728_CULPP